MVGFSSAFYYGYNSTLWKINFYAKNQNLFLFHSNYLW
jgi:hypothetical protein